MSGVQREPLISYEPLSSPTLGQIVERVEAIVATGIPLDTPLVKWYNQDYIRDELVFEVKVPLEDLTVDELLAEARANPGEAERYNAEMIRRLRVAEQAERPAATPNKDPKS